MITSKVTKRVPVDNGEHWIDVRMPSFKIMQLGRESEDVFDWIPVFAACITGWSYDEPVTPENVAELDPETAMELVGVLRPARTEADRKND